MKSYTEKYYRSKHYKSKLELQNKMFNLPKGRQGKKTETHKIKQKENKNMTYVSPKMTYVNPIMSITTVNVNHLIGGSMVQWVEHCTSKCKWYKCTN